MRKLRFGLAIACALCVALPVAAASSAHAQHAVPSSASAKPSSAEMQARATAGLLADPGAQISALASASLADQVQAQLRLARSPSQALPLLEEALAQGRVDPARVRPLLALALLFHGIEAELVARPRLHALVAWRIQRGRELAQFFSKQKVVEREHFHPGPWYAPRAHDPVKAGIDSMLALGGMAVPACRELCQNENGIGRVYGILLLAQLGAPVATPDIEALVADMRTVTQSDVCQYGPDSISRQAASALQRSPFRMHASTNSDAWSVAREVESYLMRLTLSEPRPTKRGNSAVNSLREALRTTAEDWDAWWESSREPWSAWWACTSSAPE